jgi:hypothetical protein
MKKLLPCIAAATAAFLAFNSSAHAVNFAPSGYLQASDSPFAGLSFNYFHLETFEDGSLNTPGVSNSPVAGIVVGPGSNTDSVDVDDGAIDGSGTNGRSLFANNGAGGLTFVFNSGILGTLPTHVGVVWTDGAGLISFEAFDAANVSLGIINGSHADGTFFGTTAEDRFYGASNAGGISSIKIWNASGGIEVDHLQYGSLSSPSNQVPESFSTVAGFACILGLLAWRRRKAA